MSSGSFRAGNAPDVAGVKIIALYNSKGDIVHLHRVVMFTGAREVGDKEAIETAQRYAKMRGHDLSQLKVAQSSRSEHSQKPHRINPETCAFEPLPVVAEVRGRPNKG